LKFIIDYCFKGGFRELSHLNLVLFEATQSHQESYENKDDSFFTNGFIDTLKEGQYKIPGEVVDLVNIRFQRESSQQRGEVYVSMKRYFRENRRVDQYHTDLE
jgi:hypothetical protein